MAMVGVMNTLHLEGEKYGIRVNCLSPSAATRMTDDIMDAGMLKMLDPRLVAPAVLALAAPDAPSHTILCAGAGSFECANVTLTKGLFLGEGTKVAEKILEKLPVISDRRDEALLPTGSLQAKYEMEMRERSLLPA